MLKFGTTILITAGLLVSAHFAYAGSQLYQVRTQTDQAASVLDANGNPVDKNR
jgi:hypothetical protein